MAKEYKFTPMFRKLDPESVDLQLSESLKDGYVKTRNFDLNHALVKWDGPEDAEFLVSDVMELECLASMPWPIEKVGNLNENTLIYRRIQRCH